MNPRPYKLSDLFFKQFLSLIQPVSVKQLNIEYKSRQKVVLQKGNYLECSFPVPFLLAHVLIVPIYSTIILYCSCSLHSGEGGMFGAFTELSGTFPKHRRTI